MTHLLTNRFCAWKRSSLTFPDASWTWFKILLLLPKIFEHLKESPDPLASSTNLLYGVFSTLYLPTQEMTKANHEVVLNSLLRNLGTEQIPYLSAHHFTVIL